MGIVGPKTPIGKLVRPFRRARFNLDERRTARWRLKHTDPIRAAYLRYRQCVVQVAIWNAEGDIESGTGFHIGDGWIVTARHVVARAMRIELYPYRSASITEIFRIIEPIDPLLDIALLETNFSLDHYMNLTHIHGFPKQWKHSHIPIGGHLDDWIGDEFVMSRILLMGYPRVPLAIDSHMVAAEGEVNIIVDKASGARHPYFVISPMARLGFSGGPVISEWGFLLGVMTERLFEGELGELGFAAALTVEPLWDLLNDNSIAPESNAEFLSMSSYEPPAGGPQISVSRPLNQEPFNQRDWLGDFSLEEDELPF